MDFMATRDWDERLSAYLDDEVTAAERADVEAWLETSPTGRAQLAEMIELSQLLKDIAAPPAPGEIRAAVLQTLERRNALVPAAMPVRRSHVREWFVSAAAGAITAALAFWLIPGLQPPPRSMFGLQIDKARSVELELGASLKSSPRALGEKLAEAENVERLKHFSDVTGLPSESSSSGGETELKLQQDAWPLGIARAMPDRSREGLNPLPMAASLHDADGRVPPPNDTVSERDAYATPLNQIALEDVLNNFAATGANERYIANVDVEVLDVIETMNTFQVLLVQNGVTRIDVDDSDTSPVSGPTIAASKPTARTADVAKDNSTVPAVNDGLRALYVEAPTDRLSKSLGELAQQRRVVSVRLQPPLPYDEQLANPPAAPLKGQAGSRTSETRDQLTLDVRSKRDLVRQAYTQQQQELRSWAEESGDDVDGPVDAIQALADSKMAPVDRLRDNETLARKQRQYRFGNAAAPIPQRAMMSANSQSAVRGGMESGPNFAIANFNTLVPISELAVQESNADPAGLPQYFRKDRAELAAVALPKLEQQKQLFSRQSGAAGGLPVRVLFVMQRAPAVPAAPPARDK